MRVMSPWPCPRPSHAAPTRRATPVQTRSLSPLAGLLLALACGALAAGAGASVRAAPAAAPAGPVATDAALPFDAPTVAALRAAAEERARAAWTGAPPSRITVTLGRLDPQLRLPACGAVEPFVPTGMPAWGPTRIGARCADGLSNWRVTLPATVQIRVQALVAAAPMPAGQTLAAGTLLTAEVDAGTTPDLLPPDAAQAAGRLLGRAIAAGEPLRRNHLRQRQWFAAGDVVAVVAHGPGFSVSGQGRALAPGIEGQAVSVRTETGRVVTGYPSGDHRLEVSL